MTERDVTDTSTRPTKRPGRRPTTGDKIISAGLAATTCVGLVGVIAVRSQQDAAAAVQQPTETTSSAGMTQQDLDAYAASLAQQQQALNDYRDQLAAVATQMQAIAAAQRQGVDTSRSGNAGQSGASTSSNVAVVAPTKKRTPPSQPRVRPQAAPGVVQPQTSTRGS